MNISVNYKITNNRLPEIIGKFPGLTAAVIQKTTFDIQGDASIGAPYKTGYLAGSIQASVDETHGVVFTDTEYAGYQEFGTWKMGANPFMRPAGDKNAPKFDAAMAEMLANL